MPRYQSQLRDLSGHRSAPGFVRELVPWQVTYALRDLDGQLQLVALILQAGQVSERRVVNDAGNGIAEIASKARLTSPEAARLLRDGLMSGSQRG